MQPGKYSRWSIIVAALAGVLLIVIGLVLLHRDTVTRAQLSDAPHHEAQP